MNTSQTYRSYKIAQTIEHDSDSNFGDFITKREPASKFSFEAINELTIYSLITKLPTSKASGVDKISTIVLQVAAPAVAHATIHKNFQQINCLGSVSGLTDDYI
jgi:undecaprenyl pyrophosphate synthase